MDDWIEGFVFSTRRKMLTNRTVSISIEVTVAEGGGGLMEQDGEKLFLFYW